jgi:hypothetical protein
MTVNGKVLDLFTIRLKKPHSDHITGAVAQHSAVEAPWQRAIAWLLKDNWCNTQLAELRCVFMMGLDDTALVPGPHENEQSPSKIQKATRSSARYETNPPL